MKQRTAVSAALVTTALAGVVASTLPGSAASGSRGDHRVNLGAVLVGGNEVSEGDPDGYGFANVRVRGAEVCWRITVKAVAPILAAHIHAGPAGVAGPVVVPLEPFERGCTEAPRRAARFIAEHPGEFYVNVHNADFPAGALRGQLLR